MGETGPIHLLEETIPCGYLLCARQDDAIVVNGEASVGNGGIGERPIR